MIPIKLHLSGFLSYQDPVDLDFNGLSLACVSGSNGAGKSSLLDAITWALFGEARCRDDDALINSHVNAAEVIFDFEYENSLYRIQRSKPRGKTTVLEFYVLSPEGQWRTLTEKSVRETENRLRKILRLDYETFINASFFLQGRADQFAQQQPSNRKKVLTSVLGLEIWETYRASAVERRREVEAELRSVDAQMAEIDTELAQEEQRKKRLEEIEGRLGQLTGLRSAKESELASFQRLATSLAEQKRLLDVLSRRLQETRGRCQRLQEQVEGLKGERAVLLERLSHADEVEQVYQQWVADRDELERWNQVAASFHEVQARRAAPLAEIGAVQSRLEEERRGLSARADSAQLDSGRMAEIEHELPQLAAAIQAVQEHLAERAAMQAEQQTLQQQAAGLDVENRQLKSEMKALRERIDTLHEVEGGASTCPLCGQPLNPQEREVLVTGLEADGKRMGDAYRLNIFLQEQGKQRLLELQSLIVGMARLDDELRGHNRRHDQAEAELSRLRQSTEEWRAGGAKRLADLETVLAAGDYALEARARLAAADGEARALGYDAAAHDAVRRSELAGRPAEQKLRELELARASPSAAARRARASKA
jgi:exonuclease SbcC